MRKPWQRTCSTHIYTCSVVSEETHGSASAVCTVAGRTTWCVVGRMESDEMRGDERRCEEM